MRERSTAMATTTNSSNSTSNTSSSPSRRRASGHSPSPSRPTGAAGGAALLLVDAEKVVAFEEARRKFAMYGRQNAHVSHLITSRKGAVANVQTGGDSNSNINSMKLMRKRAMMATASSAGGDGDDATVLKNTLLLQENGELALHLDDLNYRLDGIVANCGSNGDDKERTPEQVYAGAQNVVELARLLQLEQVRMVIKLASPSQNMYARIRDVMKLLLPVRRFSGDGVEQQTLGLAIAVLAFVLTQSPDADEFFTSETLDLVVQCMQIIDGDGENAETRAHSIQSVREEKASLVAVEEHKTDQPMPLKKTCLKRKARSLNRQRSSSMSSDDGVTEQQVSSPRHESHHEEMFAQIKSLVVGQEAFCVDGHVMYDLSIGDLLAALLHNLLQMDKPQEQQHNHQASRSLYHRNHRDSASATFSTVLARKRQLIENGGLDALIRILTTRFQHLKDSFLSGFPCSSSASFVHSCSLRRVQAILRVLDQASFLAVEMQQYLSSQRVLFAVLLESIDDLSELCWGTQQTSTRWPKSSAAADVHHLVAEVLLVSMRVLINLTHHNEDAAHQIHNLHGMRMIFRAFCKVWGFVEISKRSKDSKEPSTNQGSSFPAVFEEKLLFDALLMCLSALTNCTEFSKENREALSTVVFPGDGIDGLEKFKTSGVCELLTHFFLSKVQSYLRIIEMSERQGGSSQRPGIENAASLEWVPEDVVLGGCTSLLLGCLMKDSAANSSAILAMLPDGSPRLLLRALGAFVALHSQIGALTPEVGDSVLQVERTLKSFLSEHESSYATPAEPVTTSQTLKITTSVERIQASQDVEELPSQDAGSQLHAENGTVQGIKEVRTPPATAFKLQKWKKVCSAVDSDSDSGDGEAAKAPAENPVNPARSLNSRSPKSMKGRSPNIRSPSVRLPKKEKKNGKAPLSCSPAASPLVMSANRVSGNEALKQTQPSPQRTKRAWQLVSELADKLSKVSDDNYTFSGCSTAMTSTEDLSQHQDDDEWHLDFSRDQKLPPKNKTGKATPPIRILSRDSSPMTPGARKRARIGKPAHRSPNRPKLSPAPTAVAAASVPQQQQQVTVEDSSKVLGEACTARKTVSSSFENALKRKQKAAKPPPSTSATDDATAHMAMREVVIVSPCEPSSRAILIRMHRWKEHENFSLQNGRFEQMLDLFFSHFARNNKRSLSLSPDRSQAQQLKPSSSSHNSSRSRTTQMRSMHWHAEWPSADEKHELQSLKAKICRRSVLGALYFVWVCGVTGVAVMGAYSLYAITRSVLSLNAIPVPRSVAYFLTFLVLYETYHWLTPGLHRWDAMRRFLHYMFTKYPYFRRTVCLFDEEVDANAIKNEGDDAPASRQVPSDSSEADSFFVKPDNKSLFAFHPHGILSCGFGMNGVHHTKFAKSNTRWLVAENLFWFPIMRDLLHWMDSSNVKKETFVELMKKNQNIGFLPGGFEDATLYKRGTHRVFIKNRFGFIKLALQFGYKVYPVYTFGEEHTFDALPYFLHLRLKLNAFKLPAAIFMGSPWCFFMPRSNVDLVTVVGKPLELPMIKHPTKQDVQKYHALYVSSLHALFEKHKAKYAVDPDATLEMY